VGYADESVETDITCADSDCCASFFCLLGCEVIFCFLQINSELSTLLSQFFYDTSRTIHTLYV